MTAEMLFTMAAIPNTRDAIAADIASFSPPMAGTRASAMVATLARNVAWMITFRRRGATLNARTAAIPTPMHSIVEAARKARARQRLLYRNDVKLPGLLILCRRSLHGCTQDRFDLFPLNAFILVLPNAGAMIDSVHGLLLLTCAAEQHYRKESTSFFAARKSKVPFHMSL